MSLLTTCARTTASWGLACVLVTGQAWADPGRQVEPPARTVVSRLDYDSTLLGYQAYAGQPVRAWRESNDEVRRIGGWRVYAREGRSTVPDPVPLRQPSGDVPDPPVRRDR